MSLSQRVVTEAGAILGQIVQTKYRHLEYIDAGAGIYDCDCNGFVGFVLEQVLPAYYAMIPKEPDRRRPRAFKYYEFFTSLAPEAPTGWRKIESIAEARPGDIIAWSDPHIEIHENTGHVLFVAESPIKEISNIYSVRVYDSTDKPHFDDTRGAGQTGVGSGAIKFSVDALGGPTGFMFTPNASRFERRPIAIGRVERLFC
jgi:hypothetical protein